METANERAGYRDPTESDWREPHQVNTIEASIEERIG
jgi:hypothetical protein